MNIVIFHLGARSFFRAAQDICSRLAQSDGGVALLIREIIISSTTSRVWRSSPLGGDEMTPDIEPSSCRIIMLAESGIFQTANRRAEKED